MADPLSLPAEDLEGWLQANPAGSPTVSTPTTTNPSPREETVDEAIAFLQTSSQLGGALQGQNAPLNLRPPPAGIERFARPGFDLDVTTGAPFIARLRGSFAPTDEDKLALYRNAFAGSEVELADNNIIIRNVADPLTLQRKDMLVDEENVSLRDVADLADAGVQGLAELFVLRGLGRLTQGLGRLSRVGLEAAAGAATASAVGAATDTLTRIVENQPLQIGETASRRSSQSVRDFLLGGAMGAGVEGLAGTFDTMTGRATGALAPGDTERIAIRSLQELNRTAPEPILPTLGQISANPDVLRFETVMSKMPLVGRLFRTPLEQQETALRRLQEQQLSGTPLRPLDEVGAETVETLRASVNKPVQAASTAQTSLITRATDELETAIDRIAPAAQPFTTEGAAALTKLAARSQHAAFRQRANELFEAAGDPILDTSRMNRELARIREELPKRTVVNESELVDLQGQPLATTEGRVINRELVPAKLNRLMRGLDQLDPQMPLSELRRIRSLIDDSIIETRGLTGAESRELSNLREAVTRTIDDGVRQLGDTEAAQRLARANQFYREGIDRFEVPLVSRLLKEDPSQPGFIGAFELLNTIQRDPDAYRNLERFARSAVAEGGQAITPTAGRQFNILRRTLLEEVFSRARTQPGQRVTSVDADVVIGELRQLKPEVRASLLGGEARVIDQNLELLSQLKKGYKDVPEEALRNFLNRPSNSVQDLSSLATAVRRQREDFENGLLKKFLSGEVTSEALPQPQVVDWLLSSQKPSEVADVMSRLSDNPQLVESLRRSFLVGVLQKARAPLKSADAARIDDPTEVLSPAKLTRMLKDTNERRVLHTVLGNDAMSFIENYTRAQAMLGKHGDTGATTAGGLAATAVLLDIFKLVRNAPTVAKHVIFATAMTNRGLREAIMDQSLRRPLDTRQFTRLVMSSTPMIQALGEEFGSTGAGLLLQSLGLDNDPVEPPSTPP